MGTKSEKKGDNMVNKHEQVIKSITQGEIANVVHNMAEFQLLGQLINGKNQADVLVATTSRGTSARIFSNTKSDITPSASASKLTIRRWRRAGRA